MDEVVEDANKNIKRILLKMINIYKNWHETSHLLCKGIMLPGFTHYSFVFDNEILILV